MNKIEENPKKTSPYAEVIQKIAAAVERDENIAIAAVESVQATPANMGYYEAQVKFRVYAPES